MLSEEAQRSTVSTSDFCSRTCPCVFFFGGGRGGGTQ